MYMYVLFDIIIKDNPHLIIKMPFCLVKRASVLGPCVLLNILIYTKSFLQKIIQFASLFCVQQLRVLGSSRTQLNGLKPSTYYTLYAKTFNVIGEGSVSGTITVKTGRYFG